VAVFSQEAADGVPTSPFEVAMRYACDTSPERATFGGRRLLYAQYALMLVKGDFDGFQKEMATKNMREAVSIFEQLVKVLDSDTEAILDEGRRLAAWAGREAAVRGDAPDVRHPAHIAIREALTEGRTLAPGKGPDVLLKAYAKPGGEDSVCNGLLFKSADERPDWTYLYRRMARDIACRPTLNISTVTAQMRPFTLSLLMLLAWPVWKTLRWRQRSADAAFDAPAQAWRRAAATLFDGAFAGVLFGTLTMLSSSIFDELLFRGLLPFEWIDVMLWASIGIGALGAVGYLLLCDAVLIRHSRSLGKIAFDLRPVMLDRTQRLDWRRSCRRNALATVSLLLVAFAVVLVYVFAYASLGGAGAAYQPHGLVIFGAFLLLTAGYHWRPRSIGDRWSGTHVVDADSRASAEADALPRYLATQERPPAPAAP
jgi:RDD family